MRVNKRPERENAVKGDERGEEEYMATEEKGLQLLSAKPREIKCLWKRVFSYLKDEEV